MSRPKRLRGVSYVGAALYSLTFCTHRRHRPFTCHAVVSQTLSHFRFCAAAEGFAILAYCFMPDHLHMLVEGVTPSSDLQRFARLAKQHSGFDYAARHGGRLWQEGYHEHILRTNENARAFARYILANPVRAGLAATPGEFPHLGSDVWTLAELLDSCQ